MTPSEEATAPLPPEDPYGPASWPPPESLVAEAREGDQRALSRILSAGYPRLVGFFRSSGLPAGEAEDLAADVVEAMLRHFPRLRKPRAFEAWFWSIARTQLRSWIRKRRRPERLPPVPAEASGPAEQLETADEHQRIRQALGRLSARDRQLLWLREVEGLSYEEIGGRLRAASGTVRVACHRARQRLEEVYRELEADSPGSA